VASPPSGRLPAAKRREAIVDAALRVFSAGSYDGATTAQIAREAGVSEPILYRHFASKRDLYLACLDEAWTRLRSAFEQAAAEHGEARAIELIGRTGGTHPLRVLTANLWMQAVTQAGCDDAIARHLRTHLREVHEYVSGLLRRLQEAGVVAADREPDAEAWIVVAGGLLFGVANRVGGLLEVEDFAAISAQRQRWLRGVEADIAPAPPAAARGERG
jgi:AcrR family transcriptional regulator